MIKFNNVNKVYELNGNDTHILKDINFRVNNGDIFGIIGKTGSGKSTLIKLMNGFIEPDSGEILIDGERLTKKTRSTIIKETSMIFQNYNLLNNLNVLNNILLPLKLRKNNLKVHLERANELLEFVGLTNFKNANINTLSGGEKQRVAIARALITKPKVIFCDEPTSALDDITSFEVLNLLKNINKKYNTTIIIVSHNIETIKMMCNKVVIIEDGMVNEVLKRNPSELTFKTYKEALLND